MCGKNVSTCLGVVVTIFFLVVSTSQAIAGQVVGRIASIDAVRGIVNIDGSPYQVGQGGGLAAQLKNLKPGQVVRFQAKDGKLTGLVVLPGLKDIPH